MALKAFGVRNKPNARQNQVSINFCSYIENYTRNHNNNNKQRHTKILYRNMLTANEKKDQFSITDTINKQQKLLLHELCTFVGGHCASVNRLQSLAHDKLYILKRKTKKKGNE